MPRAPEKAPPAATLMQLITGNWVAHAVAVAADLRVADALAEGPAAAGDIARAKGVNAGALYRVMRALAMSGVFVEHQDQRFSLTDVGECLRSGGPRSLRELAVALHRPWHHAAWGELARSVATGGSAFREAHGGAALFAWLGAHPDEARTFGGAMTDYSAQASITVAGEYDFSRFARIADVGGGHGVLLATILAAHAGPRGVLFDLPHVAERARQTLAEAGVASRCEIAGGDFFEGVPRGCDAYLLKSVLHDWDDERCVTILRNCRDAMSPDGRVLVVEMVVPGPGEASFAKVLDLELLVLTDGGKERTERELSELFDRAGLRLERVTRTASPSCVIEASRA